VPQGVIFAGVGLDDFHAVMPTCGTGVFHAL
jgi:hypothetical protein